MLRRALGIAYVGYFVYAYRHSGFPFDRERVLLWVVAALAISGIGRGVRWLGRVVLDWVPFSLLLVAYDHTYGLAKGSGRSVLVRPLVAADKALFAGHVPAVWVQQHLAHRGPVAWWELGVAVVYASHFVVPFALAGALWWRDRDLWHRWTSRFLTLSFAAVAIYAAVPTGAPWYAASKGLVPPLDRPVGRGWLRIGLFAAPALLEKGRDLANPYAALPSLHAGYSFLVALFVVQLGHRWWRWLVFAYPLAMAFTLVYGGEHFVVDILAGWLVAIASSVACDVIGRRWRRRRRRHVTVCLRRRRAPAGPSTDERRLDEAMAP